MQGSQALHVALAMLSDPKRIRHVHQSALPQGMTTLLEIAVGEAQAMATGQVQTGVEGKALQEAADFFIEQILLNYEADSYRILGCTYNATHQELRRHMALLMRWLHPDLHVATAPMAADRQIFVTRVSRAWEDLKSEDRRQTYDRNHPHIHAAQGAGQKKPRRHRLPRPIVPVAMGPRRISRKITFWQRLARLFQRAW